MADTFAISESIAFLHIILARMRDFKHSRTRHVEVLGLLRVENLLDLRWVGNAVLRQQQCLQIRR